MKWNKTYEATLVRARFQEWKEVCVLLHHNCLPLFDPEIVRFPKNLIVFSTTNRVHKYPGNVAY